MKTEARVGRVRLGGVVRLCAVGVLVLGAARGASAQPVPVQVNERCTISVLNRTVTARPDGTWILPNVPANFGPIRARATCIIDGQTISGESDPFVVPANGVVNIPAIHFGQTTPIPTALTIAVAPGPLTQIGETLQLTVTAIYPGNSTSDVTPGTSGTTYTVSNAAIATINANGVLQAVSSGTVIAQATHEGASGMRAFQVALSGTDTDGDGIPDDVELQLGLNPNNAVDAQEDFDRDDLTNLQEYQLGSDLRKRDTDGDGLTDGDEMTRGTGLLIHDTDGDGISDGLEVQTASNPLDANSYNLAAALNSLAVTPAIFSLTFNTVAGDASVQLQVRGTLRDGSTLDLTSTQRGTNYNSNDLTICSFSATPGRVFAGQSGGCTITATVGGFGAQAVGTVTTFAPTPLSSVNLGGPGNGVDVAGDYVYVAAGGAGLKVVDVANRSAPAVIATLTLQGTANDVKLAGSFAYVAAGAAGMHVVNVSNPVLPRLIGSVDTPGGAIDVRAQGNLAFVADGAAGLQVIDVTNPAAPRIVGTAATGSTANGVDVEGTLAVVAVGAAGVRIVNVANPAQPVVLGALNTPGDALDVVVRGSHAFVADYTGSIRGVDFTNPMFPVLGGTLPGATGGFLLDIALMDTLTFGADIFFVNSAPITDVSDVQTPRSRPRIDFPGDATGVGIAVDGSYVYLGTDSHQLYIGQYRIQQDLGGVPPTVSIASPAEGAVFVEGETIPVTVSATDDLAVTGVTLSVNGADVASDTTSPYQFNVTAPAPASAVTLGARAGDLGNNIGTAADVVVNVVPDPLTTVEGRVLMTDSSPVEGASVTCRAASATSAFDGSFSLQGLSTVQPTIVCSARFVEIDGTVFGGSSTPVVAVRGAVTLAGDIVLAPVPIIDSITPNIVDSSRPPSTLAITGRNLVGSTMRFVPELVPPAIATGTPIVNTAGTQATIPITVNASTRGRFTLVGTNAFGGGQLTQTLGNAVFFLNAADDVDSDFDGFSDGLELIFGSDPRLASSTPNLSARGDLTARLSIVNRTIPFSVGKESAQLFSVVNTILPFTVKRTFVQSFSLVNTAFPATTQRTSVQLFSLVNTVLPAGVPKSSTQLFSVLNSSLQSPVKTVISHSLSIQNIPGGLPFKPLLFSSDSTGLDQNPASSSTQLPTISLEGVSAAQPVIEGQTLLVSANVSGGDGTEPVTFTVNGTEMTSTTAPYSMVFTVPAGVSELTFGAILGESGASGTRAPDVLVTVDQDLGTSISGRIVDASGVPMADAVVELLSDGLRAEFFDPSAPLDALPDLTVAVPVRSTRVTAINMRGPGGMFGPDPFRTGLGPDFVARFTGWLSVPTSGSYTFFLGADDGARLRINDSTVVDLSSPSAGGFQEALGTVDLQAGMVPIEVTFYEATGTAELQLSFATSDDGRQVVLPSLLEPASAPFATVADGSGYFTITGVPLALENLRVRITSSAGAVIVPVGGPLSTQGIDLGDVVAPRQP